MMDQRFSQKRAPSTRRIADDRVWSIRSSESFSNKKTDAVVGCKKRATPPSRRSRPYRAPSFRLPYKRKPQRLFVQIARQPGAANLVREEQPFLYFAQETLNRRFAHS
jgi:hypothetical protein